MAKPTKANSSIILFTGEQNPQSHLIQYVLELKGVSASIKELKLGEKDEDLLDLNPYHSLPTLVDRNLILYDPVVIGEYLEERYPYPSLWPSDPGSRARARLVLKCWVMEWHGLFNRWQNEKVTLDREKIQQELTENILSQLDFFKKSKYFLHSEATLVDCALVPLIWQMQRLGFSINEPIINRYVNRIVQTEEFQNTIDEEFETH